MDNERELDALLGRWAERLAPSRLVLAAKTLRQSCRTPPESRMEEVEDLGFLDIVVRPEFETARPTGTILSITPLPGTRVEAAGTVFDITVVRNTVTDPIVVVGAPPG